MGEGAPLQSEPVSRAGRFLGAALALAGAVALVLLPAAGARAQEASRAQGMQGIPGVPEAGPRGFQMVQRIDEVLYGVDPISLTFRGNFVQGVFVRVNVEQPAPILGYIRFVADCRPPLRMAIVSSSTLTGRANADGSAEYREYRSEKSRLEELEFDPARLLNGTQLVADFACRSTLQPGRARQIARELYERGGPPDQKTLRCTLRPDGSERALPEVPVRFSESQQAVAVNNQWLRSGAVTPEEIIFGNGAAEWRIDRRALQARLFDANDKPVYTGACTE